MLDDKSSARTDAGTIYKAEYTIYGRECTEYQRRLSCNGDRGVERVKQLADKAVALDDHRGQRATRNNFINLKQGIDKGAEWPARTQTHSNLRGWKGGSCWHQQLSR